MCFINSENVRDLSQPFGGTKASAARASPSAIPARRVSRLNDKRLTALDRTGDPPTLSRPGTGTRQGGRLDPCHWSE